MFKILNYWGTLIVVLTIVTDEIRDIALPFKTVCTVFPAVDNVTPELRDRANVIVASNNDDGVAEVVQRFILN